MPQALTREDVERASRREGVSHPVISVLGFYQPAIARHNLRYSCIDDGQERQKYIYRNFGFLADALDGASDFPLATLDWIAIWSKAMEVWPKQTYARYALSGILASSYSIQGMPELKGLSRHYIESHKLPKEVMADKLKLVRMQDRLGVFRSNLDEINFYIYGTHVS